MPRPGAARPQPIPAASTRDSPRNARQTGYSSAGTSVAERVGCRAQSDRWWAPVPTHPSTENRHEDESLCPLPARLVTAAVPASLRIVGGLACAAIATVGGNGHRLGRTRLPRRTAPPPSRRPRHPGDHRELRAQADRQVPAVPRAVPRRREPPARDRRAASSGDSLNDRLLPARAVHQAEPEVRHVHGRERIRSRRTGSADPTFTNFGFAWYQSDLEANAHGEMRGAIRTILLDQIFGFDPARPCRAHEHVRGRFLVQRPERRRGLRLRRDQADALQRRAQGGPARGDHRSRAPPRASARSAPIRTPR